MSIRITVTLEVPEESALAFRDALAALGDAPAAVPRSIELPTWRRVGPTKHGVRHTWGNGIDTYDPYWTYEGETASGLVRLAIGACPRTRFHGELRKYLITHRIGPAGGRRAVAEFAATDDNDESREYVAIIKGKDGGRAFFDVDDALPAGYRGRRIERYRDRINRPGSYDKAGLVVTEDDHATMLDHTWIQIETRGLDD